MQPSPTTIPVPVFVLVTLLLYESCCRREQKYQEKLALKKAQRRAAESEHEKAERKRKAKMDGTAAHFG